MKLVTWNVNGLRACVKKGFLDYFNDVDADMFCVQEIKLQEGQIDLELEGYHQYWNYAVKKGYSGTAIFSKHKAISEHYGLGIEEHDQEGRVITLEFDEFFLVNVYTPNSQRKLARVEYRMEWENDFRDHLNELDKKKPVILCGDLNVAHKDIDVRNPQNKKENPGFSKQERDKFTELLDAGFIDIFRYLYPEKEEMYTWWSYMRQSRDRNSGWRIDYFVVSERIKDKIKDVEIHSEILGSDHCPVMLELK